MDKIEEVCTTLQVTRPFSPEVRLSGADKNNQFSLKISFHDVESNTTCPGSNHKEEQTMLRIWWNIKLVFLGLVRHGKHWTKCLLVCTGKRASFAEKLPWQHLLAKWWLIAEDWNEDNGKVKRKLGESSEEIPLYLWLLPFFVNTVSYNLTASRCAEC